MMTYVPLLSSLSLPDSWLPPLHCYWPIHLLTPAHMGQGHHWGYQTEWLWMCSSTMYSPSPLWSHIWCKLRLIHLEGQQSISPAAERSYWLVSHSLERPALRVEGEEWVMKICKKSMFDIANHYSVGFCWYITQCNRLLPCILIHAHSVLIGHLNVSM